MTLCFTSRKLWRIMLRAAGPIVGRIYRYYIMYETTIKFQFSFLIQKRVLFYSLTQRSLPTSWGTWTSPERIGKRAKIFILKGLELFNMLLIWPTCLLIIQCYISPEIWWVLCATGVKKSSWKNPSSSNDRRDL